MTEKGKSLLGAVLELDVAERAWLAKEVIASLDGTDSAADVDAAWNEEIHRRVGEIERGEAVLGEWPATRDRLLNRPPA